MTKTIGRGGDEVATWLLADIQELGRSGYFRLSVVPPGKVEGDPVVINPDEAAALAGYFGVDSLRSVGTGHFEAPLNVERRGQALRHLLDAARRGRFQVLVVARSGLVRRVDAQGSSPALTQRIAEVPRQLDLDWDLIAVGDCLEELEHTASESLEGRTHPLKRARLALLGGVRGTGFPATVSELGLAANRAAGMRRGARTVFLFRDAALADALANGGRGPRLDAPIEHDGFVVVLAKAGATRSRGASG